MEAAPSVAEILRYTILQLAMFSSDVSLISNASNFIHVILIVHPIISELQLN